MLFGNAALCGSGSSCDGEKKYSLKELECLKPRMIKGHGQKSQFSRMALEHGMFVDTTLFASSESKRRVELKRERRSRRVAELQLQFDQDARRLLRLEGILGRKQTRRTTRLEGYCGASVVQRQWRLHSAQRRLVRLREFFAGRLIVDYAAYKLRASVARRAATRIQRSMLAIARNSAAKRYHLLTISSIKIQRLWRGFVATFFVQTRKSIHSLADSVASTVIVYGFTRAHLCVIGPHLAAKMIQLPYRRRLRRRRAAERRFKRPVFNTRRHAVLKRIADAARALVFRMPTHDAVRLFVFNVRKLNPDSVAQIAQTKRFLSSTQSNKATLSPATNLDEYDQDSFEEDDDESHYSRERKTFVTQPRPPSSASSERRRTRPPAPAQQRHLVDRPSVQQQN